MASDTSYNNRPNSIERFRTEASAQEAHRLETMLPGERGWRNRLPGYNLFEGEGITDKKIYQLLVRQSTANTIWLGKLLPADRRMKDVSRHRMFCGTLLLKIALSIGWTEEETITLVNIWNYRGGFGYHEAQLRELLKDAMEATQDRRDEQQKVKDDKMKDKTGYKILDLIDALGPNTPAGVARELELNREAVKKSMQRLAKAGYLESMGKGIYGLVSEGLGGDKTGTSLVRDKLNEKLNGSLSVTSFVPVLSPLPVDRQEEDLRQMFADEEPDMTPPD